MFFLFTGIILVLTLALLSFPLIRKTRSPIPVGHEADEDQERIDLEIERDTLLNSLAELEAEFGQERLSEADYHRLKAVDERRLFNILTRLDQLSAGPAAKKPDRKPTAELSPAVRWAALALLCLLVSGGSAWTYLHVLSVQRAKNAAEQQGAAPAGGMPNPAEMVARLEARLRENPDDLEGQIMAGRSYMAMNRIDDARRAWSKALELDSRNAEANMNIGIIMVQTARREDKVALEEAIEHLNVAEVDLPKEPVLLWYKGVALAYLDRYSEADKSWTTAYQNLMPGSEDAEFVRKALESLRAGNPPSF